MERYKRMHSCDSNFRLPKGWIKLGDDMNRMYINIYSISAIIGDNNNEAIKTTIYTESGTYYVSEKPDEIIDMIRKDYEREH